MSHVPQTGANTKFGNTNGRSGQATLFILYLQAKRVWGEQVQKLCSSSLSVIFTHTSACNLLQLAETDCFSLVLWLWFVGLGTRIKRKLAGLEMLQSTLLKAYQLPIMGERTACESSQYMQLLEFPALSRVHILGDFEGDARGKQSWGGCDVSSR